MIPARLVRAFRSLGAKVVLFLSLALLPVGLIALFQTREVKMQVELRSELALQALTERAARREREIMQSAYGALALAETTIDALLETPELCAGVMHGFLDHYPEFSFFGFLRPDMSIDCSSAGAPLTLEMTDSVVEFWKKPERTVNTDIKSPISDRAVISIMDPVTRDGKVIGALTLSIPHNVLDPPNRMLEGNDPVELITFNEKGTVLTASSGLEGAQEKLPRDRALVNFVGQSAFSFTGLNRKGERRSFAVVPVLPGSVYALGAYQRSSYDMGTAGMVLPAWFFPILMWAVSLIVAYVAMERLVIRYIRRLQRQMRDFSSTRRIPVPLDAPEKPQELRDIDAAFMSMTETLLRDEAEMENAMHEKVVLLKEVHHRVKNNLQLISSIMNMKLRKTKNPDTIYILRRLQQRVLGLARIHQGLYQTQNFGSLDITDLANAILDELAQMGEGDLSVCVIREIQPTILYPDQAVPLTLLLSEATTNAMKFASAPKGETPWIKVELYADEPDYACLIVSNSISGSSTNGSPSDGAGLGKLLIRAFNSQLEGDLNVTEEGGIYKVALRFKVASFLPEPNDY
ncbi:sensor histidine kinase [Pontibaca salina]|uniref:histidine kinase n=1 Tax=Pontibaca salina TaxID=2795731 RepID=A0A934LZW6_9RHOB|nr:sensor histidine kinase [Pontibaca salina]MBI6629410.1 sensor histidine kinase [Pontibaca salina]